jgi:hypothetical protein
MTLGFQKFLFWSIQLAGVYLFCWWGLVYLSFASNIEVGSLTILEFIKAIFLGAVGSLSLFLSIFRFKNRVIQILVAMFIFFGIIYYFYLLIGKVLFVDFLGLGSHILAMIYLVNNNFRRS